MNLVSFLRFYLIYLLYNIGGWVYFGYLLYYTSYITNDNCNDYIKDLTIVIKFFVGISMSTTSLNILSTAPNILHNDSQLSFENISSNIITNIIFLTISCGNSFAVFCLTSAMTNIRCSNDDAEFGVKLSVYGVVWIAFIEIFLIILAILFFIAKIIVDAELYLLFEPCINIYKKYKERRIAIEPTLPKYNTNHITIPIPIYALKEKNKILCSVCYDSSITLLLEPCNHICICQLCYNSLVTNECPICKTKILATRKIYFANPDF